MRGLAILFAVWALPGVAFAQTDYSAGKTPAQLFAGDCSACHKTPRGLAKGRDVRTLTGFLREHYTSKASSAGALAAYLTGNPGPPPEPRGRQEATGTPGEDDTVVPEGGRPARESAKSGKKKSKKLTPAEQAAKTAEEIKAKVQAYANASEAARPLVVEAPPAQPAATTAAPAGTAAPPAETPASSAQTATPAEAVPQEPHAETPATPPAPAAESKPPAEERPATTPPG